jgi:hypothetical protein
MRFSSFSSLFVGLFFVSSVTLAVPVSDATTPTTVLTPHGQFPASNVHRVPEGTFS